MAVGRTFEEALGKAHALPGERAAPVPGPTGAGKDAAPAGRARRFADARGAPHGRPRLLPGSRGPAPRHGRAERVCASAPAIDPFFMRAHGRHRAPCRRPCAACASEEHGRRGLPPGASATGLSDAADRRASRASDERTVRACRKLLGVQPGLQDRRHLRGRVPQRRPPTTTRPTTPTRPRWRPRTRPPRPHPRRGAPTASARASSSTTAACTPVLRARRRRLRDHHGELQPRDRLHRLRHLRQAVLRAAHLRGRHGRRRRRPIPDGVVVTLGGQTPLKLAHALWRRPGCPSWARARTPSIWPRTATGSPRCSIPSTSPIRARLWPRGSMRPAPPPARSATRCSCAPATCSEAGAWASSTMMRGSPATWPRRRPSPRTTRYTWTSSWKAPWNATWTPCATARTCTSAAFWSTSRWPASTRATRPAACRPSRCRRRCRTRWRASPVGSRWPWACAAW